ncbi:5-oxoprolinase subunit PxpB [Pseudogulbenkiania subflava]|uniref:Sensor histidine kinase inhibitor, KipI family n=1 Tax=Pseudogulbenkiania subflava DSM 22618 TaxID=1123014 RepID=A0A1Y6BY75_9NEIS|nr:5-oxoprolinase subunit PxpB [Pseudogulbenkiania subflava]SMF35634.1 sensor histidine kinase inhibitor, KipI family [Pseudogulbenkiania subflava DSM 22618]
MKPAAVRFYLLGERAAVLAADAPAELACQRRIWWLASQLRGHPGLIDIVPGMNNLTVVFDPLAVDGEAMLSELQQRWSGAAEACVTPREVRIPVRYGGADGPDLDHVARHAGLSPAEVVAAHSGAHYTVFFLGFQPGFAYLGGLPEALATPRRAEPRLAVPAGSVAIGGSQTGVYPAAAPGGWHLIGRTALTLFDPRREPPSLLLPGDSVRFVAEEADHA